MGRKEDIEAAKKKLSQKEEYIELSFDAEISILLQYLKVMPISIRAQFIDCLKHISMKQMISEYSKATIASLSSSCYLSQFDSTRNSFIVDLFCKFLKLKKLREYLTTFLKKNNSKEREEEVPREKGNDLERIKAFQPNLQKSQSTFDPIEYALNPNYENYVKMWKLFTDTHLNLEYKAKDLNPNYSFFSPPRFFLKIEEMRQFQSSFPEKGNILMLSFEGDKIIGKKGFAVSQGNMVYWWEKNAKSIQQILGELAEEKQKQKELREKQKKKQNEKEESKLGDAREQPSRLSNPFKLHFKMVGHHGKVTSMSLSDDEFYLISAGTDKTIKLWCLRQKMLLAEYKGHLKTIWSISFNRSGYFFLSGSADKTIKLWATDDSKPMRVYSGHSEDVIKVDFMQNPDLIISASYDRSVRLWNTLTTDIIHIFRFDLPALNFKMSLSGKYLAVSDIKGKITLYDLFEGQLLNSFFIPQKDADEKAASQNLKIHDMCFSLDQKQFSCVSSKYLLIYSFDKLCERNCKNLHSDVIQQNRERPIATKEVINTGRESNLVYCAYHDKGVLVVATTIKKKY